MNQNYYNWQQLMQQVAQQNAAKQTPFLPTNQQAAPPPTSLFDKSQYSRFGNAMARGGGFGPMLNNSALQQQITTPDQLEMYNQARKAARNKGLGQMMYALSDAFGGRNIGAESQARQQQMIASEEAQRIRNQRIQTHAIIDQKLALNEISAADAILLKNNPSLLNDWFKSLLTPPDPKPISDLENQLRDEHTDGSGEYIKVKDAYARVDAAGRDPSAAGDLALIFNFMKMLDPGSTVREGEFANAQNSAGVRPRIQAQYNSIINGERLAETQRNDFMNRADSLYQAALRGQKQLDKAYEGIATRNNVNPENVIIDYASSVEDIVFSNKLRQLQLIELENYDRSKLSNDKAKILDKIIKDRKAAPTNTDETTETTQVIPEGSVVIGSLNGKTIYRTPDGEQLIQE